MGVIVYLEAVVMINIADGTDVTHAGSTTDTSPVPSSSAGGAAVRPPRQYGAPGLPQVYPPGGSLPLVPAADGLPPQRQTFRPERIKCFNCSGWGHTQRDCPSAAGTNFWRHGCQGAHRPRRGRGDHRGGHSSSGAKVTNISL